MIDRERILIRIDHLKQYLHDLRTIIPPAFEAYEGIEKRRACKRLLQLAIEAVTDISGILVAGLRLGLPAEGLDTIAKLRAAAVITPVDGQDDHVCRPASVVRWLAFVGGVLLRAQLLTVATWSERSSGAIAL